MRIALMTNNYKPFIAGVPISVERLAKGLEAQGHQVTVFAPTYAEQEEEENCFRYASFMQKFIGGVVLPNPLDRRIEKEFRKNRYDIIHVHHPMLIGRTAAYLSKKYDIPLTFTYHTRYEQYLCYVKGIRMLEQGAARGDSKIARLEGKVLYGIQEKIVPAYLNTFLKHCNHIFAPTAGMKEYLINGCGYAAEHIDILPTGIEEKHFCVTQEEKDGIRSRFQAENMPLFLSVSRMAHEKNVSFLLQSIARFKERFGRPFRLLMVGDGPNRGDYEKECERLGIGEEVVFTGKVPNCEIAPYFAAADAFVFASKTETQGIVILEAFAGGTPVIALDATGVSDLVSDGANGLLCMEENCDIFAGKVLDYVTDEALSAHLLEGALKSAAEYREEAVAQKAIRIYNSVIAEYRAEKEMKKGRYFHQRMLIG